MVINHVYEYRKLTEVKARLSNSTAATYHKYSINSDLKMDTPINDHIDTCLCNLQINISIQCPAKIHSIGTYQNSVPGTPKALKLSIDTTGKILGFYKL